MREASRLASSSCARYWASTACASAWASSARLMPPWIASSRSLSRVVIRGSSILPRTPNTMMKTTVPRMNSGQEGSSGFCAVSAARLITWYSLPSKGQVVPGSAVLEDERGDEADQGQCLGQREADPHVQRDAAGRFRLPRHGLDRVAEDQADADARADGREAVADGADVDAQDLRAACGDSGES